MIVTKQSLNVMLNKADDAKKILIIGRALVALFERQTESEQQANTTANLNGVGFAGSDARSGSLTAKSFLKNKTLAAWQVERWMKPQKDGFPRICKYVKQLNEIAEVKAVKQKSEMERKYATLCMEYGECVDSDDPKILEPIMAQMREIEVRLGNVPHRIQGAAA
jgi:hypothetical protein